MTTTTLFPDATNTGVPAGVTLTPSGGLVITQAGAVISGLDITGQVSIEAPNVTIENCKITSDAWSVVTVADGITGAVVKNCEINGLGTNGGDATGISGQGTFLNNNISNVENGLSIVGSNITIQGNYVHDMNASGSPHYDGIQIDGNASNVTISNNTIINNNGQTSAVMIDNDFGPISNIQVHDNLLVGGGYTVYSDGRGSSGAPITGVSFTNNHMGAGQFGFTSFDNNNPAYSGNVNDGAALAATLNTAANTGNTTTGTGGSAGAGSGSSSPPPTQTADTVAPDAPIITGDTVIQNKVQFSGTAEAGSTINLYEGSTSVGTTHAAANGHWNLTTSALSDGAHALVATATDAAGNTSDFSQVLDPVVGSSGSGQPSASPPPQTNSNEGNTTTYGHTSGSSGTTLQFTGVQQNDHDAVTLTGTADSGSHLQIYDGTEALDSVTTDTDGNWTCTTFASPYKAHTFTAHDVDSDGDTLATTTGAVIVGSNGHDKLISTSGSDILAGKGGADTFVFAPNFGHNIIADFTAKGPGHDTIDFSKNVFDSFASVLAHASQDGHDVVISAGSDTLTLKDMKLAALNSHDFHFG